MDPEIGAYVQGRHAYYKLIRRGQTVPVNPECLKIKWDKMNDLEVGLFNFSSTMGALLTYILLHVMIQGNPILYKEYNRKGSYYMNNRRKDRLARQWIDGFLSGILTSVPHTFRDLIFKRTGYHLAHSKDRVKPFDGKKPRLYIDDSELAWLSHQAFRYLYPSISKILDGISTLLPKAVNSQKASFEAFEKSGRSTLNELLHEEIRRNEENRRSKQSHDHEFKVIDVKAGVKYFKCKICHRKKSEPTKAP